MSLQDTIRTVATLRQAVQNQLQVVNSFIEENGDLMQMVTAQLQGSTKGHDQKMLASLAAARESLVVSLARLNQAESALLQVEQI